MDTYKTISEASPEILYKEKNSKFFGYALPVSDENQVKEHLDSLRKQHPGAGHLCYAWQIGTSNPRYRANDDGEPAHSAGTPIYGQIQSFGLTNVLVVIVRIFGGVKLGVGGLISAYRTAAQLALEESDIVEKIITVQFDVSFGYADLNKVMRIIKERNLELVSQQMDMECRITVAARLQHADAAKAAFESVFGISVAEND